MTTSTPREVHFLACVHGMWGTPAHLSSVEKIIKEKFPEAEDGTELVVLRVETNADSFTYDGLDWGAERAVKEIMSSIKEIEKDGLKKVTRFSIFGYSLGGLISRYTIGILYQRDFFKSIKPVNFTTFATPHIGLPRFRGVVGRAMFTLGPIMLSRTGKQFYCVDNDLWSPTAKEGRPLLAVMADKDSIFFKALSSFPHITVYGNSVHDLTVVYCTSMIEAHDPFTMVSSKKNRLAIKMDPQYRHVIDSIFPIPEGEEIPLHDLEKELKAERDAIPWYKPSKYRSRRPLVPPMLQFPFPLNLIFYILFPFFLPVGLSYAALRFRRESRGSEKRLAELAASPDAESSLSAMLRKMEIAMAEMADPDDPDVIPGHDQENEMEEGVAGDSDGKEKETRRRTPTRPETPEAERQAQLERGAGSLPSPLATPGVRTPAIAKPDPLATDSTDPTTDPKNVALRTTPDLSDPSQPLLTEAQLGMIDSLNSIPQLQKVRAYFPFVRNAHSVIVARDPGMWPEHESGFGVLRHWADRFEL